MGLDAVETILWAEKEFEIDIPDSDAANIVTVGQFSTYIHNKLLMKQGFKALSEKMVFEKVKEFMIKQFEMQPDWINRDAEFVRDLGMS